eukprot:6486138-Amphidinium_carterae.5
MTLESALVKGPGNMLYQAKRTETKLTNLGSEAPPLLLRKLQVHLEKVRKAIDLKEKYSKLTRQDRTEGLVLLDDSVEWPSKMQTLILQSAAREQRPQNRAEVDEWKAWLQLVSPMLKTEGARFSALQPSMSTASLEDEERTELLHAVLLDELQFPMILDGEKTSAHVQKLSRAMADEFGKDRSELSPVLSAAVRELHEMALLLMAVLTGQMPRQEGSSDDVMADFLAGTELTTQKDCNTETVVHSVPMTSRTQTNGHGVSRQAPKPATASQ